MWNFSIYDGLCNSPCVYWQGFFDLSCALNNGFFFGLEPELCVGFEFHFVSTCSRFKITLRSSPWKTGLQSARTFVDLTEPANPCFSFRLIIQTTTSLAIEQFRSNLVLFNYTSNHVKLANCVQAQLYRVFWLQPSIILKNVLNLGKVKS